MKWFIKALRHYADFSGRARRMEYWYFTLFNALFAIVWIFAMALMAALGDRPGDQAMVLMIYLSWMALVMLPGLAVAVRRLHDTGRSGWMVLIALIPFVGTIWLIVLMATEGKRGWNEYGPDPKATPESYDDRAKLYSLGVALTVTFSFSLLANFLLPYGVAPLFMITNILVDGAMLTAGILLLRSGDREKARGALMLLMIATLIVVLRGLSSFLHFNEFIEHGHWATVVNVVTYPLLYLSIALFCAALLFARNPRMIRHAGTVMIVLWAVNLLWRTYSMQLYASMIHPGQILDWFAIMKPAVFILLGWTFLSRKEERAVAEVAVETGPRYQADEIVTYNPTPGGTPAGPAPGGSGKGLGWKIFGLLFSVALIFGGLSGEFVLRGTNSSTALVVAGILFLIWDIISIATHNKSGKKKQEYEQLVADGLLESVPLDPPATIRVVRESSIVGAIVNYNVYLNHEFIGKLSNGKNMDILTTVSHNIITVYDHNDMAFSGEFTADLEPGGYAEVHVKAGRFVKQ